MIKKCSLAILFFICSLVSVYGQVTIGIQDFETSPAAPTMTYTGGSIATGTGPYPSGDNNFVSGSRAIEESNGTSIITFSSVDASAYTSVYFTCRLASFAGTSGNGNDGADEVYVEISDDGGSTWSQELEVQGNSNAKWSFNTGTGTASTTYDNDDSPTIFTPSGGGYRTTDGYSTITINGLPNISSLRVRLVMNNNSGNEYWIVDDAEILGTPSGPTPTITTTQTTLTSLDYVVGSGPSVAQSYSLSAADLTPAAGDITVTAPTNFSISKTVGGTYTTSLTYAYTGSTLASSDVYVRLNASLPETTYGPLNITNTGGGATAKNVSVDGEVTAAPPANDDCSGAISLTANSSCTYVTYTNENATDSGEGTPSCSSYGGEDVWFSVLVPASGEITIDTNNIDFTDSGMTLYSGTCGALTEIECDDDDSSNGFMSLITRSDLTPATTVYIRVWEYGGGTTGDFGICVTTPTPCVAPVSQPTTLVLSNISGTSIDGAFTATTADSYLVVASTSATLGANPVDTTSYSNGDSIGTGTVVQSSSATTFTVSGLSQTTQYYFFVFALNDSSCAGGPTYNTTSPLTDNATTITGPCLSDNFDSGYGNWTGGSGTYNNSTAGNTGDGIGFNTNNDDIISSTSLTNPTSISFVARASGSTSNFTIDIQYGTTASGPWTSATSIVANGSNTGDITNSSNSFNLTLNLTGNYFLRILQSPRSGGSFYLDDVDVFCGTPTTTVEFVSTTSTLAEDGSFIDICVAISNEDATTATTVEIALDGSSTAINGTDYDDGAGSPAAISFPQTLTFPAGSSANQCLTIYISNDDAVYETSEDVILNLQNPAGGDSAALGTNTQHTLSITDNDPIPMADVVITEISYNSTGTDDEWIEICNISGSTQDLSDHIIDNGSVLFTFPGSTTIADGTCITISLGSNGDGTYNNDCPFTPDFGIDAATNDTNNLNNSSDTINLFASDGTTVADSVFYDDADGADDNGATLHVTDATANNSDTGTNWQEVDNGGTAGTNSLISPCSIPELQLVDSLNIDQACGYTIDFSDQATGFNTDITFDIDNDGTLDLTITTLILSGTDLGEFSIVSPATPFTVTPGNTQTVTMRFSPTSTGVKNATLTINNNDADESTCTVLLLGNGTIPEQEINIEGDLGTFPDITNGDLTPNPLDNTFFAAQNIGNSQSKSFRIQNLGTDDLSVSGITIGGDNPGDFTLSINPTPVTLTPMQDPPAVFEITFSPLAPGTRTAIVSIASDDADEDPYTFMVEGTGNCNTGSITILPSSGPVNTIVTVTGTNLSTATATFNGLAATVTNISATEMEVTIPSGATSGPIDIIDDLGCPASATFTVIKDFGSCGSPSGLMITEVYDETVGSRGYIELYNATGATIDLTLYRIDRYPDLVTTSSSHSYTFPASGTGSSIADGEILVGMINSGGPGVEDFTFGGSVSGFNDDDRLELILISTLAVIDDFHDETVGTTGYVYRRNTNVANPNTNFDASEWTTATSGDTTHLGTYSILTNAPTISVHPQPIDNCNADINFNIVAAPGDSGVLTYQWKYNDGVSSGWVNVLNASFSPGTVTGETTNTLDIAGVDLQGYQFYCEVTEDGACSTVSNAARVNITTTTWDGTWSNGEPSISVLAIINANYDTATHGSFSACSLTVNNTFSLTVNNDYFVEIENDVTNNGTISVSTSGSFLQNNDAGTFTNVGSGHSSVTKQIATTNSLKEYTYWSSPVHEATFETAFPNVYQNRRYWFNAQNYLDATMESDNNNATEDGQDDEDDNGDDWTWIAPTGPIENILAPGAGFITYAPISGNTNTFSGPFHNGIINVPVYKNNSELDDNNWNLIGNPYPSAINADDFLTQNFTTTGVIEGTIYLWSHNTAVSGTANGNYDQNYESVDYAQYNGSGGVAGGDNVIPSSYIPTGQGFMVQFSDSSSGDVNEGSNIYSNTVVFNNSLRVDDNNNQFFRTSNTQNTTSNKLWLTLSSDNGISSQILVSYLDGASALNDGSFYDAPRDQTGFIACFYSIIPGNNKGFAIQGKASDDLNLSEEIPLGIYTTLDTPTLYTISIAQLEGSFLSNNTIYLEDALLSTFHDLSNSDYTFTSATGEFNNRFKIVFNINTLSTESFDTISQNLTIVELQDDTVKFSIDSKDLTIKSVKILDVLGREIYNFSGSENTEFYNIKNVSSSIYIAQIELSNGHVITKKALKK